MPPKKAASKGKLHVLAPQVPIGTKFVDNKKRTFVIGKQFATGGFGRIHTCCQTGDKTQLAVKVEPAENGPLFTEINVFQRILRQDLITEYCKQKNLKSIGVPPVISTGIFDYKDQKLRYLVMPKYSGSFEAFRNGKAVDARITFTVGKAVLQALEYIHSKNYTHGDVKAGNILLPTKNDFEHAVLVDYGLARMATSNQEKPDKKRAHNGTAIFTSLDAHIGLQPSYRGDMEILLYNLVYWLSGTLPWAKDESNPASIHTQKESFRSNLPVSMRNALPKHANLVDPLVNMYKVVQATGYTQTVDYVKLYKLFDSALSSSKKGAKKADEEEDEEEEEIPSKENKKKATNGVSSKTPSKSTPKIGEDKPRSERNRGKLAVNYADDDEEEEEVVPRRKAVVRPTKKPVEEFVENSDEENASDEEEEELIPRRAPITKRKKKEEVEEEEEIRQPTRRKQIRKSDSTDEETPEKQTNTRNKRRSAGKDDATPPKKIPIPGLANKIPKSSSKTSSMASGVSTTTKANAEELRRNVPGLLNFTKGRRSEIINEIANRHK